MLKNFLQILPKYHNDRDIKLCGFIDRTLCFVWARFCQTYEEQYLTLQVCTQSKVVLENDPLVGDVEKETCCWLKRLNYEEKNQHHLLEMDCWKKLRSVQFMQQRGFLIFFNCLHLRTAPGNKTRMSVQLISKREVSSQEMNVKNTAQIMTVFKIDAAKLKQ